MAVLGGESCANRRDMGLSFFFVFESASFFRGICEIIHVLHTNDSKFNIHILKDFQYSELEHTRWLFWGSILSADLSFNYPFIKSETDPFLLAAPSCMRTIRVQFTHSSKREHAVFSDQEYSVLPTFQAFANFDSTGVCVWIHPVKDHRTVLQHVQ